MNLYLCDSCHHEWQGYDNACDWCGGTGEMLVEDVYSLNPSSAAERAKEYVQLCKEIIKGAQYHDRPLLKIREAIEKGLKND